MLQLLPTDDLWARKCTLTTTISILSTRQVIVVCATQFGASMDSMLSSYPEDETEEIFPLPVGDVCVLFLLTFFFCQSTFMLVCIVILANQ